MADNTDIKKLLQKAQGLGRGKDTILAHITPEEAKLLKSKGGKGTLNPKTGLLEFDPGADAGQTKDAGGEYESSSPDSDSGGFSISLPQFDFSSSPEDPALHGGSDYTPSENKSLLEKGADVVRDLFGKKPYSSLSASEKQEVQDTLAAQESSGGSSSSNSTMAPALTFEQLMELEKEKQATIDKEKQALEDIDKKLEEERLAEEERKKQEKIDAVTVGGINTDQQAADILNDPEAFLTGKGATVSDKVPTIDPNAAGTNIADYDGQTSDLSVTAQQGTATTAQEVTQPAGGAETYDAISTVDKVSQQDAEAQQAKVREQALVDAENAQLDMQGMATGKNRDGSINETGIALQKAANLDISNIIDTTTPSGKLQAELLGQGNYVDYKSTVQGQLDLLSSSFQDANGNPKIPAFASAAARNVSRIAAFKGVTGTAATAAMSTAIMESMLPVAQADAKFFQTVQLKNLDNRQQQTINTANILSRFELANQDSRMTAAVTNAKTFMQMDLQNLANKQQTEIVNTQNRVQSILEDAKAENVSRRFAAQSQNEMDMFYDNLNSQVQRFNVGQQNAMSQFNVGQVNDASQFNATLENNREQFYDTMQYNIDASNAKWRQTVTLTETEMQFEAAALDAKNMLAISTEALNQIWDRADSQLDHIWKSSEGQLDRDKSLEIALISKHSAEYMQQEKFNQENNLSIGNLLGTAAMAYLAYKFPAASILGGGGEGGNPVSNFINNIRSDVNLKTDLVKVGINNQGLNLYIWEWNNIAKELGINSTNSPTYGVVAQEAVNRVPSAVSTNEKTGYLQVDYSKIHLPPLENISVT